MKMTILFVVLFASVAFSTPQPGLPFLLIWPTARSTALAGAVIGLADNPDAAFFNPAGLAFQSGIGAAANYGDWLPGFYPDMHFGYLSLVFSPKAENARAHHHLAIGLDASYLNLSNRYCIIPELPPPYPDVWRGAVGVAASFAVTGQFSVGAKAKLIQSELGTDLGMEVLPELGIDDAGTGTAWAGDVGALWRPSSRFSLGASVANLGPGITYSSTRQHDPSPTILRIGACWTLMDNRYVRLSIMPEWDKLLVGMLYDSANAKSFGREMQTELRDAWKALGIEVTGLELVTVRLGYFEDMYWNRGGIVFERDGGEYRHNLYDLLTRRALGEFRSISLCWGFGIGHKDYFRFDVSSDAAIYDFPTSNWKFSLVANDIAGGIRELKQGHVPWKE